MVELPVELWALISTYFTPDELAVACGVHRAFFERLVDTKYREAKMRGVVDDQVFISLANPAVSRRVHSITLDTLNFKTYLLFSAADFRGSTPAEPVQSMAYLRGLVRRLGVGRSPDDPKSTFPALQSLSITVSSIYKYAPFIREPQTLRCLDTLWRSVMKAPLLTSLALNIAIEAYRDEVVPSKLFIPTLTNMKLGVWAGYTSTDYKPLLVTKLAPLINRHAGSLRHLSIDVQEACFRVHPRYYDCSPLFQHLQYLPKATALGIKLPLLTPLRRDSDGLHKFVRAHSQQVTELSVQLLRSLLHESLHEPSLVSPYTEADYERLPLFDTSVVPLPLLQKLDFTVFHGDAHGFPFNLFQKWTRGQPSWTTSLKSLCLTSHYLSPRETTRILPSIRPFSGLQDLSLAIRILRLEFLVKLKEEAPRLKNLELRLEATHWIQSVGANIEIQDALSFVEDIRNITQDRRECLADWSLHRLAICVGAQRQGSRLRQGDDRHKLLVELFPRIDTVEYSGV